MEKAAKQSPHQAASAPPKAQRQPLPIKTLQRRAGDVEQDWQRAELDPANTFPFPLPIHGRAGLTWAVLPTGEKVKWSDLGMDRRLEGRLKVWLGNEGKKARR